MSDLTEAIDVLMSDLMLIGLGLVSGSIGSFAYAAYRDRKIRRKESSG